MRTRTVAAVVTLLFGLVACTSGNGDSETLTVYAAASLKDSFTEIGELFEERHPGVEVEFSFAGSSDLVAQLTQGAAADVFATADTRTMTTAVAAGLVAGGPVPFATNTLTIVAETGNPENITNFGDLRRPDLAVVVCAPQVPCGAATARLEDATGVDLTPVSEESSVTDVLGKVRSGQADAGLVYITDAVTASDSVTSIPVPEAAGIMNTYPIARLQESRNAERADEFVRFVTGTDGRAVLDEAGFGAP